MSKNKENGTNKVEKEPCICENCGSECESLVTRQGFVQAFFCEWVCLDCFTELEGKDFDIYGVKAEEVGNE